MDVERKTYNVGMKGTWGKEERKKRREYRLIEGKIKKRSSQAGEVAETMKGEGRGRSEVKGETEAEFYLKKTRDSQHEVLLPAGQVAPDSNGCALHILYF